MVSNGHSEWHSIRPWAPRLALFVREITSVSATFILSSSLSDPPNGGSRQSDPSLASLGLIVDDEAHSNSNSESESSDSDEEGARRELIITNALAKGLSVNVNGSHWQRVLIRIDDKADEAIIIIYGLMPGRQYDIDLALVQGGQGGVSLRRQVITEESGRSTTDVEADREQSNLDFSSSQDHLPSQTSAQGSHPLPTPPQSPSPSSSHTPSSYLSIEDRTAQLQHTLSLLHADRTSLTTSLKSARRDAQKADAALRSQIDTLKRASEKHTAAEHRARQKVLALQEAVKRAQATTAEMEELVREVDKALPALQIEKRVKERVYEDVLAEAEKVRCELEKETEIGRKKIERGESELAGLGNRLERIHAKRGKLEGEGGTIAELEDELREVQIEIERIEKHPYGYTGVGTASGSGYKYGEGVNDGTDMGVGTVDDGERFSYLPPQHNRLHSQPQNHVLAPIGRPTIPPIQRPSSSHVHSATSSSSAPGSSASSIRPHRHSLEPPFVYHPPTQTQIQSSPHSQSQSQGGMTSPQRVQSTSSLSSPSTSASGAATTTMLSSKAPAFEPSRGVEHSVRASFPNTGAAGFISGVGVGGIMGASPPAQRPAGSASRKSFTKWGSVDGL